MEIFLNANYPHEESMEHALNILGYENVKACIPFTLEEINKTLSNGDYNLNTLQMNKWDMAAGFKFIRTNNEELMYRVPCTLTSLYKKHGLNHWSCSEGVSLLKYTAKKWADEVNKTHHPLFGDVDASKMSYDEYQDWLIMMNID